MTASDFISYKRLRVCQRYVERKSERERQIQTDKAIKTYNRGICVKDLDILPDGGQHFLDVSNS